MGTETGPYLWAGKPAERSEEVRVDEDAVDLNYRILKGEEPKENS